MHFENIVYFYISTKDNRQVKWKLSSVYSAYLYDYFSKIDFFFKGALLLFLEMSNYLKKVHKSTDKRKELTVKIYHAFISLFCTFNKRAAQHKCITIVYHEWRCV